MFITKNNKINLSSDSLITSNVIIIMGLFFFSCENTITKSVADEPVEEESPAEEPTELEEVPAEEPEGKSKKKKQEDSDKESEESS